MCEARTRGGNKTRKGQWEGVMDREDGKSGKRRGEGRDCSSPMRVGVKKSEASPASKVDNGGHLF